MTNQLSPYVKEYFKHDKAASTWWNVDHLPRYSEQAKWMVKNINFRGKCVLDLGVGKGRFSIAAAKCGAKSILAVDISKQMIREAKNKAYEMGVGDKIVFVEGDIEEFASKQKFDCIILMEVLVHLPNPGLVVQNAYHLLNHGGVLVTNIDSPLAGTRLFQHFHSFLRILYNATPKSFRNVLHEKRGWPLYIEKKIILDTTENTLKQLNQEGALCSRAYDAYRVILYGELKNYLKRNHFMITNVKREYYFGIPLGHILICTKH